MMLMIAIDEYLDEPIYVQVARQLREFIATNKLKVGEKLPTVRELASDLSVNLNTIARAYRLLESEGFLTIRNREGAIVAAPSTNARQTDRAALMQELQSLLARIKQSGIPSTEIVAYVKQEIETFDRLRKEN